MLTKDQDIIPGTAGNDTVNGLIDLTQNATPAAVPGTSTTFNGFDTINGAAGVNTFKLAVSGDATGGYTASLANIEKIQVVELNSTATGGAVTVDASAVADLTDLKVTKATAGIVLTGSATQNITTAGTADAITIDGGKNIVVTDATANKAIAIGGTTVAAGTITVTDTKQGTGTIDVDGGTDVTITATTSADLALVNGGTIKVGLDAGTPVAPTGAVKITQNLVSTGGDADADDLTGGAISVKGGKTVEVTINATSTATKAGADGDITIGTTTVTGDSKTTDVTVTQNASVTTFTTPVVAETGATQTVTFKALTAGQTTALTHGGNTLTFTAAKALKAEEVAQAFADLVNSDRQDNGGPTANGTYSGQFAAAWASTSVSGAVVTFTANANNTTTLVAAGGVAPTLGTLVAGVAPSGGVPTTNTVTLGNVVVNDNATEAIKTITLNGFKDATLGGGGSLDALTTLNLTNSSGDTKLTSTSTTLALNANGITNAGAKVVDLSTAGAVETLTLTTTGTASDFDLVAEKVKSLTIDAGVGLTLQNGTNYDDALETVVVKGAGAVDLGDISAASAGNAILKSFSAADNTGGVTVSVSASAKTADVHSTFTKYVLSQGNDNVTLTDATVNKAIELGAGDDTITLAATTTALAANIDGGTGSNTLVMNSADAAGASTGTTFEAKISGFDKLGLNAVAAGAQDVVNLDNLDDIKYVISAGAADTKAKADVTITVTTQLAAGGTDTASITLNGVTVTTATLAAGVNAAADEQVIALGLKTKIDATPALAALYTTAAASGVLTITSKVNGMPLIIGPVTVAGTATDVTSANSVESSELTLDNMLDGGTLELTGDGASTVVNMKDATGDADSFNIVTKVASTDATPGSVTVADVETINITATDTVADDNGDGDTTDAGDAPETATLYLTADAAKTVNVTGNANLSLTLAGSDVVELVDASTAGGALTFTASLADLVVKGGTGADALTANANGVKLYGNDGADTFTVNMGFDSVRLFGGAGNDTFVIKGGSTTNSTYTVIDGVNAGDVIKLSSGAAGTTAATSFKATKVELSQGATVTTQALIEKALGDLSANQIGWFTNGDYTFLVVDGASSASTTYQANDDVVVMLVGVHDLSTASYNSTSNTLEIA